MSDIRISQVMIVKNEEKNIERALSWGRGVACEQIVVDTGSTDATVQLAEKMGATVYHFDWCNDFSAAKNFAIARCSGDWIAFLDADEYLMEEDAAKLQTLIAECDRQKYELVTHAIYNLDGHGGIKSVQVQGRFFKNNGCIRYVNAIHECLVSDTGDLKAYDAGDGLRVYHTGYMDEVLKEKNAEGRNRTMLVEALKKTPEDVELCAYLADVYFTEGDFEKARELYEKSIALQKKQHRKPDQRLALSYAGLMQAELNQGGKKEKINALYKEAVYRFPKEPDLPFIKGSIELQYEDYASAADHLMDALVKLNQYGYVGQGLMTVGNLMMIYKNASYALYKAGREEQAFDLVQEVIKNDPDDLNAIATWLEILRLWRDKNQITEEAEAAHINALYPMAELKRRMYVMQAAGNTGDAWLVSYVASLFSDAELAALKKDGFAKEAFDILEK